MPRRNKVPVKQKKDNTKIVGKASKRKHFSEKQKKRLDKKTRKNIERVKRTNDVKTRQHEIDNINRDKTKPGIKAYSPRQLRAMAAAEKAAKKKG